MITYKNRLPVLLLVGYIRPAPHKTGAGFRSLLITTAHNRASGFFTCKASSRLFIRIMAGRTGEPKGSPGSVVAGTANPVRLATSSFAASGGELTAFTTTGATSWQTANAFTFALTLSVSIHKPKSTAACTAHSNWLNACISNPSAITVLWWRCVFRPFSAIWLTIYVTFTTCLTAKSATRNTPENLTQKQHSACWWGVRLSDIQEAL
ncbi:TPA: ash family protein [Salmonella enterica subsp. enterica serovar Welikade]|nr:ash family protein [Salmonella enterica subsp. enterica serovar Welikade]